MTPRLILSGLLSLLIASFAAAQIPGSSYEILALGGTNGPGVRPLAGLVLGPDGNYYGTASDGGEFGGGAVFKLTPAGELSPLVSFSYEEGHPSEALIVGSDGNLYGTTEGAFAGTPNSKGTIFRVTLMIGGLIVGEGPGVGSANVFVRGIGPSLSGVGVSGPLPDPTLEFRNSSGTLLAANDDWKIATDGASQQAKIEATTIAPTNDLESALLLAVPPRNYTALLRGKANTAGVGVVEVYNLP